MPENAAIALDDVTIRYGTLIAVERLTMSVRHGEIFGLLGPNGSGKSSTLSEGRRVDNCNLDVGSHSSGRDLLP